MTQPTVKVELRYGIGWKIIQRITHALAKIGIPIPAPALAWAASRLVQVRVENGKWKRLRATTRGGQS